MESRNRAPQVQVEKRRGAERKSSAASSTRRGAAVAEARGAGALTFPELVREVEQILSEDQALAELRSTCDDEALSHLRRGGILLRMKENGWHGKGSEFYGYVREELGFGKRDVQHHMAVYENLCKLDIPWEKVQPLGWFKLRMLSSFLTRENVEKVVAEVAGMTTRQVQDYLRAAPSKLHAHAPGEAGNHLVVLKIRLGKDQEDTYRIAIGKARKESKTESDAVALERICLDFLAGVNQTPVPQTLKEYLLQMKLTSRAPKKQFEEEIWPAIVAVYPDEVEA